LGKVIRIDDERIKSHLRVERGSVEETLNARHQIAKVLYALPYFRGRDRLISMIAESFVAKPTSLPEGIVMLLDASEWLQLEIVARGAPEPATLDLIRRLVRAGDTVIDVGAHVGYHALVAAQAATSTGRVYAIDAQPYNVDRIARNAAINGFSHLTAVSAAIGRDAGFVRLPLQMERDRARLSLHERGPGDLGVDIEVPLRRLDEFLSSNGIASAKLVKIDVEGYELEVLLGLDDKLRSCQNLVVEVLQESDRARVDRIVRLLHDAGFTLRTINGSKWSPGMALCESNLWASST
jgi:FkbM family methyltransferase